MGEYDSGYDMSLWSAIKSLWGARKGRSMRKNKRDKPPKPSKEALKIVERQMRRLEAAGWLTFHGFRASDGFIKADPSDNLLRMIAVSGMPAELVVARLLQSMDALESIRNTLTAEDIERAAAALKTASDEPIHYV